MNNYVEFINISKKYKDDLVLDNINFSVSKGEFIVILGPSGSGKSTLLELICGFENQTNGNIKISGEIIDNIIPRERNVSMIFQNYALMPHLTVYENIAFGMKIRKEDKKTIVKKVSWAVDMLELSDHISKKPSELSGGQRQRVAIGRAIVREPKLFLMDEPLSNLDYKLRIKSSKEIVNLNKSINGTTIYVTHDQEEALTMADRIVILNNGVVNQIGTPREIYENPENLFVARFIGRPIINTLDIKIKNRMIIIGEKTKINLNDRFKNIADGEYILGIRPENIKIDKNSNLEGTIEKINYIAGEYIFSINIEGNLIKTKTYNNENYNVNDKIKVDIDINKINIFDKKTKMNMGDK